MLQAITVLSRKMTALDICSNGLKHVYHQQVVWLTHEWSVEAGLRNQADRAFDIDERDLCTSPHQTTDSLILLFF